MLTREDILDAYSRVSPDPNTVTLRSRAQGTAAGNTYTEYTLTGVRPKRLSAQQIENLGGLIAAARFRVFQIWQQVLEEAEPVGSATLPCPEPKVNDIIRDGDEKEWVIRLIDRAAMRVVRNCLAERAGND